MIQKLKRWLKKIYFFGNKFYCPYCNSHLRVLFSHGLKHQVLFDLDVVGGRHRENVKCPICNSTDRERLLYFYFKNYLNPATNNSQAKILHIAPEKNLKALILNNKKITYIAGDMFAPGYEHSYPGSVYADICQLEFPDNSFDYLLCNHVLEHVVDYPVALSEIKRTLKPGGFAVVQVPIALKLKETKEFSFELTDEEKEREFGQADHVRLFASNYDEVLAKAGFIVSVFSPQQLTPSPSRMGLNAFEKLYVVQKPVLEN